MADVTIHGRSIEDEIRTLVEERFPEATMEGLRRASKESLEHFRGRFFSDSTDLIREDRER